MTSVKLIECPRDAWQGLPDLIPTELKANYLRELVLAGFKHIDAVSFVSPNAVPQMADSEEVLKELDPPDDESQLWSDSMRHPTLLAGLTMLGAGLVPGRNESDPFVALLLDHPFGIVAGEAEAKTLLSNASSSAAEMIGCGKTPVLLM